MCMGVPIGLRGVQGQPHSCGVLMRFPQSYGMPLGFWGVHGVPMGLGGSIGLWGIHKAVGCPYIWEVSRSTLRFAGCS